MSGEELRQRTDAADCTLVASSVYPSSKKPDGALVRHSGTPAGDGELAAAAGWGTEAGSGSAETCSR